MGKLRVRKKSCRTHEADVESTAMSRLMVGAGILVAAFLGACAGQEGPIDGVTGAATATGPQGPQGPPGPVGSVRQPEVFQEAKWVSGDDNGNAEVWTYCPVGARVISGGANITGAGTIKASYPMYNNSNGRWLWVCRAEGLPRGAQSMACNAMCELP